MDGRPASDRATAAKPHPRHGLRHSAASLRSSRSPGSRLSLLVAFVANLIVAAAKLAAGLLTGSAALLAEAAHSLADSNNEVLLAFSFRRARRAADAEHPFGYGGVRFLWAFLAAIASFVIGGCLSVGLAINDLVHGNVVDDYPIAWIVLGIAAIADGTSLIQTMRQARREAAVWGARTIPFLAHTSDPTLRALAVEDSAALIGLVLAAAGLGVHELGGPASSDAIASLLIGILLGVTAIALARPLADLLLIGSSVRPERLERARRILEASPRSMRSSSSTRSTSPRRTRSWPPRSIRPRRWTSSGLARSMDELDARLRSELPEIGEVFIDVTQHSSRDTR